MAGCWAGSSLTRSFPKNNGVALRKVCARFDALCPEIGLLTQARVAINGSKFEAVKTSRDT